LAGGADPRARDARRRIDERKRVDERGLCNRSAERDDAAEALADEQCVEPVGAARA